MGYELPRFTERQLGHIGMRASLLAALFLICACLTPSLAQTKELWPLAIGNEWNFNARALGANVGETMRLSITSTEKIGDTDTYVLTWSYPSQGRVFQKEYYAWKGGKLYAYKTLVDTQSNQLDPPMLMLDFPLSVGHKWTWNGYAGANRGTVSGEVISMERTTVPAGTFSAYKIRYLIRTGNSEATSVRWFAEGVGLVREEDSFQTSTIVTELMSYRLASSSQGPSMLFVAGISAIVVAVVVIFVLMSKRRRDRGTRARLDSFFTRTTCEVREEGGESALMHRARFGFWTTIVASIGLLTKSVQKHEANSNHFHNPCAVFATSLESMEELCC